MKNTKKLMALLLVVAMLFAFVSVIAACKPQDECEKNGHTLTAVAKKEATTDAAGYEAYWKCSVCGKMFSDKDGKTEITKPVEIPKLTPGPGPQPETHTCKHVCPTCGKCTDSTCTDPVCKDKCQGHEQADPDKGLTKDNPLTPDEAIALMDKAGNGNVVNPSNKDGYYVEGVVNAGSTVDTQYHEWNFTLGTGTKKMSCGVKIDSSVSNKPNEVNGALDGATVVVKGFLELYKGKYQCDYLPANVSPTGAKFTPSIVDIKVQELPPVEVESVTLNTSRDTLYLLPWEGNYIELTAWVLPADAPQDIEWTVEGEDKVTFSSGSFVSTKFGRVTYKGQEGTITLTATAKDTDKSASVTIVIQDRKGTKQDDPITVDEAIALIASNDQYVKGDDSNETHGFYITGTVAEGSKRVSNGWEFSLLGSDGKTLACSVKDDQLTKDNITVPLKADGGLDGSQILFYAASMHNDDGVYSAGVLTSMNAIKSLQLPALTAIEIEAEQTEVTVPYSTEITVKSITPANAVFENVEWITSDETKATVSGDESKATITSVAAGEVKISVRCANVTSNEITLTISEEQAAVKAIYDWTIALEGKVCDSTLYSQRDPREMITEINQWTPGQQEIKSFVTEGTMYDSIEAPGIAYIPAKRLVAGQITIQTLHEIKKVTIKVVPFADATTTQLSINTISKTHEKDDSVYTGDPSSAIDIVFELTEATTTLNVEATGVAGNSFAIVGMTFEW